MTESKLWGTSKTSFQDMGEAKIIVRHSKPVNYDLPAGRTMHIESIFIENAEGERFRYPYKHLNGARALATHVAHGGNSYDDIGQHIIGLSEELNKLRMFKGYVDRHPMVAEAMDTVNQKVYERIDQIKKEITGLQRPTYYQQFAENFTKREEQMIPEDVVNDWVDRLTIRNFNEELKNVFPYIYNLVGENVAPVVELTPDDILASQQQTNESEFETEISELADFESYLEAIVKEDNDLFNTDETQSTALQKLNQLMGSEVPAGTDGTNAIQSLKGIIDDNDLNDALKSLGKINPEGDVRDTIKQYIVAKDKENGTDVASKITAGDTPPAPEAPPAEAPTAEAPPAEAPPEAAAAPAEAPAEQPAPVAESDDNDPPWHVDPKEKAQGKTTPGKHGQGYSQARHLARQGMQKAIEKAKKAGATAETVINFGQGEMTLGEAISKAGLKIEDYFAEAVQDKKQQEVVEFIKSMYDETTGRFPKGETGVLLSVEKEFGEDMAHIARHVISELSTIYEANELRRLAGMPLLEFGISDIAQGIGKGVGAVKGAWQGAKDSFSQGMAQGQAAGQAATGPAQGSAAQPAPKGTTAQPALKGTTAQPAPKGTTAQPAPKGTTAQPAPTPAAGQPTTTSSYKINGKPVDKATYDAFMAQHPELNPKATMPGGSADEYAPKASGAFKAAQQQYGGAQDELGRMQSLAGLKKPVASDNDW